MPLSKKRKKKGKKVGNGLAKNNGAHNSRLANLGNLESHVTLQDLINAVAYQEYVKDGTIVPEDVEANIAEGSPVYSGEGDDRRQVGTASPIPGDPDHVSITITDPEAHRVVQGPDGVYSIADEENN